MATQEIKTGELEDFFSGKDEVELTNELIEQLVKDKKWSDVKSLTEMREMEQPVRIFKCPCEGNKFKLAGQPNNKPTLKEKREYGEYIAVGCTVITIPVKQFREENWEWCPKHF